VTCSIENCGKPPVAGGLCRGHYTRHRRYGSPLAGSTAKGAARAFLKAYSDWHDTNGCLIWPFARNRGGYGLISIGGKCCVASREMCRIAHGEPQSPEMEAAHICGLGHTGCVNPNHLRWATSKENSADTLAAGRTVRGERHKLSKLTESEVRAIRTECAHLSGMAVARKFGIAESTVRAIRNGKKWGWLQ
jgi:hypothetical protein